MENLLKKDGKLKLRFQEVLEILERGLSSGAKIFHLKKWTGSYSRKTLLDSKHYAMIELLNAVGIIFDVGNDAPRRGKTGDYIEILDNIQTCFDKLNVLTIHRNEV